MYNNDRRASNFVSEAGYRETDKNQIVQNNLKFLNPEMTANLYKIISKINQQHIPVYSLAKSELNVLFYGHIFTNSVNIDGTKRISEEDMKIYSEIMAECYSNRYSDAEMFIYQRSKDIPDNQKKDFQLKADAFRAILTKFEKILGQRDRI